MEFAMSWAAQRRAAGIATRPAVLPVLPVLARLPSSLTREVLAVRQDGVSHEEIRGSGELDLVRRYQAGDRHAGEILIRAHAPMLRSKVAPYSRLRWHDLDCDELIAEAQLGFLYGVQRFDPSRNIALTTYAMEWARSYALRACQNNGATIRVPVSQQTGKSEKYRDLARGARSVISLDTPIEGDEDRTVGSAVMDDVPSPETLLAAKCDHDMVHRLIADTNIDARERAILERRLMADEPEDLQSIAQLLGCSREGIRRAEIKLLNKLRRTAKLLERHGKTTRPAIAPALAMEVSPPKERVLRGCRICGHEGHFTKTCERWAGKRFSRLVILRGAATPRHQEHGGFVLARCDCGTEKMVRASHLARGKIESCGCLRREYLEAARAGQV